MYHKQYVARKHDWRSESSYCLEICRTAIPVSKINIIKIGSFTIYFYCESTYQFDSMISNQQIHFVGADIPQFSFMYHKKYAVVPRFFLFKADNFRFLTS